MTKDWQWFLDRTEEGDGQCIIWTARVNTYGYPVAHLEGKPSASVRTYIYTKVFGKPLRKGFKVSAKCEDKRCISDACLVQRSNSDIVRRSHKSRAVSAGKITETLRKMGYVRLNLDIAREIRASNEPTAYWSQKLGVTEAAVRDIKRGKRWPEHKHGASVFTWAFAMKEAA